MYTVTHKPESVVTRNNPQKFFPTLLIQFSLFLMLHCILYTSGPASFPGKSVFTSHITRAEQGLHRQITTTSSFTGILGPSQFTMLVQQAESPLWPHDLLFKAGSSTDLDLTKWASSPHVSSFSPSPPCLLFLHQFWRLTQTHRLGKAHTSLTKTSLYTFYPANQHSF